MRRKRVLVIGDVMIDRWIEGPMTRISPEAPSPIVREKSVIHQPGGAANVAVNIAALGNPTLLCGVVGRDWEASWLRQWLTDQYEIIINLVEHPDAPTICKARVACEGQQVLRVDREDNRETYTQCSGEVMAGVQAAIQRAHDMNLGVIVIADYNKGTLTQEIAEQVLLAAGALEIPVLVDTKPANLHWYRGASLLKPNFKEAAQMCESLVHPGLWMGNNEDRAMIMARHLQQQCDLRAVVITMGARGVVCFDGQHHYTQAVEVEEVFDVTGAGDTFMAVLADSAARGRSLPEALRLATTAATHAVQHHRTFVITRVGLDEAMLKYHGKVVDLETAVRYVDRQRDAGRSIVMTNGKFRFLHHGHVESFRWAKEQGDFLVVAANTDVSLDALAPGEARMPERYRAEMIAQQPCVDLVVLFDDPSVEGTVRALKPNILVKGAQYQAAVVPGADFVARSGGEVRFSPMIGGVSVTKLLESAD